MPRHYAQITTELWKVGNDFRDLSVDAQLVYFMLASQPDISAAGVLHLSIRRWAKNAADMTPQRLVAALNELHQHGQKVIVDRDTEELLVRGFIRADKGYGNEKRRGVIKDAAMGTLSPLLRASIAVELLRLGLTEMALAVNPDAVSDALSHSPSDALPDGDADSTPQNPRVVVTKDELEATTTHNPQHASLEPGTGSRASGDAPPRRKGHCSKHPNGTDQPCGPCASQREAEDQADLERRRQRSIATSENAKADYAARALAIRNCQLCNDDGYRLLPDGQTGGLCDHQQRDTAGRLAEARALAGLTKEPVEATP